MEYLDAVLASITQNEPEVQSRLPKTVHCRTTLRSMSSNSSTNKSCKGLWSDNSQIAMSVWLEQAEGTATQGHNGQPKHKMRRM